MAAIEFFFFFKHLNVLMVMVVGYCVRNIILLCCLYYFNMLNIKIKPSMLGLL